MSPTATQALDPACSQRDSAHTTQAVSPRHYATLTAFAVYVIPRNRPHRCMVRRKMNPLARRDAPWRQCTWTPCCCRVSSSVS
ncbi:hypothetical protein [Lysobacter gummosus]|uniref:hypothetical protein n=1 Tax=Lysobacter gummosus TaxID=262324 RepID=UPI003629FE3B